MLVRGTRLRLGRWCSGQAASSLLVDESRSPPVLPADFYDEVTRLPEPFPGSKVLRVSILGMPNSGKSSLGSALVGSPVFAASSKVHTTRVLAKGIVVHGPTQLILSDTPGIVAGGHLKKLALDKAMAQDPERSIRTGIDHILVVVDAADERRRTRISPEVLHLLYKYHPTPATLVLNKADAVKNSNQLLYLINRMTGGVVNGQRLSAKMHQLLDGETEAEKLDRLLGRTLEPSRPENERRPVPVEEKLSLRPKIAALLKKPLHQVMKSELWSAFRHELAWPHFSGVFVTSALEGRGVEALRQHLVGLGMEKEWAFSADLTTDQGPRWQAMSLIRAQLLNHLPHEIPYKLRLRIEIWELNDSDTLHLGVAILAGRENWLKLIIGPEGKTITAITKAASDDLQNVFRRDVFLRLAVRYSKSARFSSDYSVGRAREDVDATVDAKMAS